MLDMNNQELATNASATPFSKISSSEPEANGSLTVSKPRVSFNRDVHVKRIGPRDSPVIVSALTGIGNTAGSNNRLLVTPLRRQKLGHLSRKQLAEEVAKVLQQVDRVQCTTKGTYPEKFYSLPSRKKNRSIFQESATSDIVESSEQSSRRRRRSEELGVTSASPIFFETITPPKKPPRSFLHRSQSDLTPTRPKRSKQRETLKNLLKIKPKSKLKRSKSDVTKSPQSTTPRFTVKINRSFSDASDKKSKNTRSLRKRSGQLGEDLFNASKKSQLSPIIEVSPAVEQSPKTDYFTPKPTVQETTLSDSEKENISNVGKTVELKPPERKKSKKLQKNSNVDDSTPTTKTTLVIIDVENAKNIPSYKNPLRKSFEDRFNSTIRSLTKRKKLKNLDNKSKSIRNNDKNLTNNEEHLKQFKQLINKFEAEISDKNMIHSSQKFDKLPLTKGKKVDNLVRRLSTENYSPPPKTPNVLITPTIGMQHNNNQPFSYTKPLSPTMEMLNRGNSSPSPNLFQSDYRTKSPIFKNSYPSKLTTETRFSSSSPYRAPSPKAGTTFDEVDKVYDPSVPGQLIYAQVVCGTDKMDQKQTIHRSYDAKKPFIQNSDSDEGLGYEENRDKVGNEESQISPKYHSYLKHNYSSDLLDSSILRGRADGMDSKRRGSLTDNDLSISKINERTDLSSRRELLESRINSRNKLLQNSYISPISSKYEASKLTRNGSVSPVGFSERYTSESFTDENVKRYTDQSVSHSPSSPSYLNGKDFYQSTPELLSHKRYERPYNSSKIETTKYSSYHDSLKRSTPKSHIYSNEANRHKFSSDELQASRIEPESEDEGFQSSLLISTEKHNSDEFPSRKLEYSEYQKRETYNHRYYKNDESRKELENESDREYRLKNSDREYKTKTESSTLRKKKQPDYVPRERSIDDGSHFDPRIDKDFDRAKLEKKPPKIEKKMSNLEKVKNLFVGKKNKSRTNKASSQLMVGEEEMRARYSEYKGSKENLDSETRDFDYSKRKKLTTPRSSRSPSPHHKEVRSTSTLSRSQPSSNNWFKSLDRLTRRNKNKPANTTSLSDTAKISETDVSEPDYPSKPQKSLRFFGDTDNDSNNESGKAAKTRTSSSTLNRSQSYNRSRNDYNSDLDSYHRYKSTKPPVLPERKVESRQVSSRNTSYGGGKKLKRTDSVAESSTEGDSSQQSQRSVVYLHAATVGDIPGRVNYPSSRVGRRATSREELSSIYSTGRVQPQVKTLSRSFSVLAPWKPRHRHEGYDIDYSKQSLSRPKTSSIKSKIESKSRNSSNSTSTLNRRTKSKDNISSISLNSRKTKSRDDLTNTEYKNGSTSTLNRKSKEPANGTSLDRKYRSKDNLSTLNRNKSKHENTATLYKKNNEKNFPGYSDKSMSMESLGDKSKTRSTNRRDRVSRSISMPKDKSAGWFGKRFKN